MLRPHLTLPGAGEDSESKLGWQGPPSPVPVRPPTSGPCATRLTDSRAGHGAKGQLLLPSPRPPAPRSGRAGRLRSWERASQTPRAGLAGRAPAVQRLAANRAGSRPIAGAAYDKAAGGAAPPEAPGAAANGSAARSPPPPPLPAVPAPVGPAVTAAAVGARGSQLGRCAGSGLRSHPDLHRFETSGEGRCGRGVEMLRNESPGAVTLLSRELESKQHCPLLDL